jgi:hypothetical protein
MLTQLPDANLCDRVLLLEGINDSAVEILLTPHIGGSTEEAQDRIGRKVANKLLDYLTSGSTMGAVNFPQVQLQKRALGARFSRSCRLTRISLPTNPLSSVPDRHLVVLVLSETAG